jgi:hypothetical protein
MPNINAILQDLQSPEQYCQAELNMHKVFPYLPRRWIAILTWFNSDVFKTTKNFALPYPTAVVLNITRENV